MAITTLPAVAPSYGGAAVSEITLMSAKDLRKVSRLFHHSYFASDDTIEAMFQDWLP